jgi:ATP-dependent DNA ligase
MLARPRTGFDAPCLPTKTDKLPSGDQWLREIKHDGFRIIARKNGAKVRLYSRPARAKNVFSNSRSRSVAT